MTIQFTVNGKSQSVEVEPQMARRRVWSEYQIVLNAIGFAMKNRIDSRIQPANREFGKL